MASRDRNDMLVNHYMQQLKGALRDLPAARRQQILEDIAEHIQTARLHLEDEDETAIRQILEQLGDPESIRAEAGLPPVPPLTWGDRWAPWLLLFGGFLFMVGWLFGLILLWQSRIWRIGDKVLGTLIWPGGLAAVVWIGGAATLTAGGATSSVCVSRSGGPMHCTASTASPHLPLALGLILLIIVVAAPVVVALRLLRVSHRAGLG